MHFIYKIITKVILKFIDLLPLNIFYLRSLYHGISTKILSSQIRHTEPSIIHSPENLNPNNLLMQHSLDAVKLANEIILKTGKKNLEDYQFLNIFPGEHYRLLNAFIRVTGSTNLVEIGTFTGMGSLAMIEGQKDDINLKTYDIFPWDNMPAPTHLDSSHFNDGKIKQIVGDLSNENFFEDNFEILNSADIIFMDAPKDGIFEYIMINYFLRLGNRPGKFLIIDDIRVVNMIDLWSSIVSPKIDLTSFGHWSGTGIVDISNSLQLKKS